MVTLKFIQLAVLLRPLKPMVQLCWGSSFWGGTDAPTDTGYTKLYSTNGAFAALKADGSITSWGNSDYGNANAPTDSGYISIYSTDRAFTALKFDSSITSWGLQITEEVELLVMSD